MLLRESLRLFLALFLLGIANAQAAPARCPPVVHVIEGKGGLDPCEKCERDFEKKLPRGSRIYAYDLYDVEDGFYHFQAYSDAVFTCTGSLIRVTGTDGRSHAFPSTVFLQFHKGEMHYAVLPGKAVPQPLQNDIRHHRAYFLKVT